MKIYFKKSAKGKGSSIYVYIPIVLLFFIILFYINTYDRAAEVVADNLKTSIDSATLSSTTVNMDQLLNENILEINGFATQGGTWSSDGKEKENVIKHFVKFENALQTNVGLDDTFMFSGGTCGWGAGFISNTNQPRVFQIDQYTIYEIIDNTIVSYNIENVSRRTLDPPIVKKVEGTVTRDPDGKVIDSTVYTPGNHKVVDPTIYVSTSFPIRPLALFSSGEWLDQTGITDPDMQKYLAGTLRVSKSSTTSIKTN